MKKKSPHHSFNEGIQAELSSEETTTADWNLLNSKCDESGMVMTWNIISYELQDSLETIQRTKIGGKGTENNKSKGTKAVDVWMDLSCHFIQGALILNE